MIIGTAAYMAPEQARGKAVDRRADIWAFGVVLFEMLTGRRLFPGDEVSDVLAAVLTLDVDWSALPATTPGKVRRLLARCLERDAKLRLRDIGEARVALTMVAGGEGEPEPSGHAAPAPAAARVWWRGPLGVVAGAALGIAVGAIAYRAVVGPPAAPSSARVVRAALAGPKGADLQVADRPLAVSLDGTEIVVAAKKPAAAEPSLFVRTLSRVEWRELPDTSGATYPVWSPDGRAIAFFAGGKLKRIDVADGIVRAPCDAPAGRGAAWSPKGVIVFAPSAVGGLWQVSESGGTPAVYSPPVTPGETQRMPHLLADGRRVIHFSDCRKPVGLYVYDPDAKSSTLIMPSASEARYVAPGYLVFVRDENILVQPFDAATLTFTGEARPIAAGAHFNVTRWFANFDVTAAGVLVYQLAQRSPGDTIAWMDRTGAETAIPVSPGNIASLDVSRDGTRALVNVIDDHTRSNIAVIDLVRGVVTPFNLDAYSDFPRLIDGGRRATFEQSSSTGQALMVTDLAGANAKVLVAADGMEYEAAGTSPDGGLLVFSQRKSTDKLGDLMVLDLVRGGPPTPLLKTPPNEFSPRLSPRGDLVAYLTGEAEADEPGMRAQLGVVAFPVAGEHPQATTTGLACRECWGWLGDHELFWQDAERRIWSVAITARDGRVDIGVPTPHLGGKALERGVRVKAYAIDRGRFVVTRPAGAPPPVELAIVTDWRALLDGAKG